MLKIGEFQELKILRETDPGLYLANEEGDEVLLPHKYKPVKFETGDVLNAFVYLDNQQRPVATTLEPHVKLNDFGYLRCSQVNKFGAFMDWGIEKQLFVPYKEQARPMKEGSWYVVRLYLDSLTGRLVGSSKTRRFLQNDELTVDKFDQVEVLITHITEQGAHVIVNGQHQGLIYIADIFEDLHSGDRFQAYIKKIRPDKKLDVVLQSPGYRSIEPNAQYILEELTAAGGFLPLHDKSEPKEIKDTLGLSKKSFKKAIGSLYKDKKIKIIEGGIELC
ncbi:CvfB family protein [Aureitalea marina]|uniref:GntR family transcriptional regulator n=1 Tax=Aureitalea marina TaxID=930804 RepID=A0A2S7KNJ9_9FLAO|nr:S1-like domain-containing RNA-binding protein [Aureitalea marina]PQB04204.1 GntR family transcriptional regulator [Aureitalea marina]